jgi:hypothetical protein
MWDEGAAPFVKSYYEAEAGQDLTCQGEVEAEDLFSIIDYLSLDVDINRFKSIVYTNASFASKTRAAMFHKALEKVPDAVESIVAKFEQKPSLEKSFVGVHSSDSLENMSAAAGTTYDYISAPSDSHTQWMGSRHFQAQCSRLLTEKGLSSIWSEKQLETSGSREMVWNNSEAVSSRRTVLTVSITDEPIKKRRRRESTGLSE